MSNQKLVATADLPCSGRLLHSRAPKSSKYACPSCRLTNRTDAVQIGTLDDVNALSGLKPGVELFAKERIPWVEAVAGTQQKDAMS